MTEKNVSHDSSTRPTFTKTANISYHKRSSSLGRTVFSEYIGFFFVFGFFFFIHFCFLLVPSFRAVSELASSKLPSVCKIAHHMCG